MDKRSKVMPDIRTSQLVVVATEPEMASVDQLIQRLDTQTKQVLIEARILETTVNPTTTKGVDWTGTLAAQHVNVGNNACSRIRPNASVNNTLYSRPVPNILMDTAMSQRLQSLHRLPRSGWRQRHDLVPEHLRRSERTLHAPDRHAGQ